MSEVEVLTKTGKGNSSGAERRKIDLILDHRYSQWPSTAMMPHAHTIPRIGIGPTAVPLAADMGTFGTAKGWAAASRATAKPGWEIDRTEAERQFKWLPAATRIAKGMRNLMETAIHTR